MATTRLPTTHNKRPRVSAGSLLLSFIKYALLLFMAFMFLLPLLWMVSSALKVDDQVFRVPPIWIPIPAHFNNFYDAWHKYDFTRFAFNSVFRYSIPSTIFVTVSSAIVLKPS